ncbi:MAG: L-lactate dehydrogenase [Eubacteriales bacterium]|nr:L-lactate dehydrogenase [Eubacteriales bacterium]MDD3197393.1 L-lactate dehydrogenase [Eubacteriales bacterium]MDD3503466.1 L-lactate dehydrogenase [Eubacteriales bacterium]MDD4681890.1 L-lactate dehydrogenase [Eubacteriales bacterium]
MSKKVTIIGTGNVGSTIAYTLAVNGIASEIVIIDINQKKALGEALDIRQGIPFCPPASIYAGDFSDAAGSDIVILTSGLPRKPGQSRLDLAQTNVDITKQIIPKVTKYATEAVYVVVSNPVDILTYVFNKVSDLPQERIIGSGTILDTARLRSRLSEYYKISQQNVHAYVFGEHGDTSFVPWSLANISSIAIDKYHECLKSNRIIPKLEFAEVEDYIRKSGAKIIDRKGATYYAVSVSVCHICKCLFNSIETSLTVSTMMNGEYGIDDVCLSTLSTVGKGGIKGRIETPLTDDELKLLHKSADALKNVISNLTI